MKNVDSKLLLGLIVGAAVGAAVGYLAATDKRDELLSSLGEVVDKAKDGLQAAVEKFKAVKEEVAVSEVLPE